MVLGQARELSLAVTEEARAAKMEVKTKSFMLVMMDWFCEMMVGNLDDL